MRSAQVQAAAASMAALLCSTPAKAQSPDPAPSSPAVAAASSAARVRVVAEPCGSGLLDISAFAVALRVELTQEGVRAVDVVAASGPSGDAATSIEIHASPCNAGARAVVFEIRGPAAGAARTGTIALGDVDSTARSRVAALAVAEAFRATVSDVERTPAPAVLRGDAPPPATPAPVSTAAPAAPPPRVAPAPRDAFASAPARPAPLATTLAALLDVREFTAYASGVLGPRAEVDARLGASPSTLAPPSARRTIRWVPSISPSSPAAPVSGSPRAPVRSRSPSARASKRDGSRPAASRSRPAPVPAASTACSPSPRSSPL
jgi:hypothetical protein